MKSQRITKLLFCLATGATLALNAQTSSAYVHTATASTIYTSKTMLDTVVLNGNANLVLLATHNYNPVGQPAKYVDKSVGFRFQSMKWYIYTNDVSGFVENSSYNIFIPGTDAYAWTHTSTAQNITSNYTEINDGRINNNPNAKVFVVDQLGNYNPNRIAVFYRTSTNRWCIYNQGGLAQSMPENQVFNVIVPKGNTGYSHVIHTADGTNTNGHISYLDHPDANDNPDAIVFVTQVWNPGGTASGVYNDHHVGVYYSSGLDKWTIYNEDLEAMPLGSSFNVMVFKNSVIGTEEFAIATNQVRLQPNPALPGNGVDVVLGNQLSGTIEISVYDLTGKLVLAQKVEKTGANQTLSLPTESLGSGMYILKVANNGKANAQKLIIQ
jgi:hypothetical protein